MIGVMSGTSLDGLDIALCRFEKNDAWKFDILKAVTVEYPEPWLSKLKNAPKLSAEALCQFDNDYGSYIGQEIQAFAKDEEIDFVASHGHTVFHRPDLGYTKQIGNPAAISAHCSFPILAEFRTLDVALGGQGAPLVPIGDQLLFGEYQSCLNLGGFANISFERAGQRIAYDICPVNIVLNALANKLGKEYDANGEFAQSGEINPELLDKLNALNYYSDIPPKSLGREWVENEINPLLMGSNVNNLLRTFVEHIAIQLSKNFPEEGSVLITGGGTFNSFLIDRISAHCSSELILPDKLIIDFKEALIFAFLGVLRWRGENNTLKSVTGASRDSCGGSIYY